LSLRRISDARRTEEGGLGSAGGGNERVGGDWSEGKEEGGGGDGDGWEEDGVEFGLEEREE